MVVRARIGTLPYRFAELAGNVLPGTAGASADLILIAPADNGAYPVELDLLPAGAATGFASASVNVSVRDGLATTIFGSGIPAMWSASQTRTFNVTVSNAGALLWNARGADPVVLLARFVNAATGAPVAPPVSVSLAADVAPDGVPVLLVTMTAPADLTNVALDLRMVKQGVTSIPANLRVPVTAVP